MIKIWVDDERPMPEGYTPEGYDYWCKSVFDAIELLAAFNFRDDDKGIVLDLDHDAGEYRRLGGDYIKILEWMEYSGNRRKELYGSAANAKPAPIKVHFQSANPVGVKNMRAIVENCPWMEEV